MDFEFPNQSETLEIQSLATEVFNGRYCQEIYRDYGKWLPYITTIFLPIIDSEHGDFIHLPLEGGILDQPYMTMSLLRVIQNTYRKILNERMKAITQKKH